MISTTKSGCYLPNIIGRVILEHLEEVLGISSVDTILEVVNLSRQSFQTGEDNFIKNLDFHTFSLINKGILDIYGQRGGKSLAIRTGRAIFVSVFQYYGALAGVRDQEFYKLPLITKMRIGIPLLSKILGTVSDQTSMTQEHEEVFTYSINRCPECWSQESLEHPVCYISIGLFREGLKWVTGGFDFRMQEKKCIAAGNQVCEFVIQKTPS